jgi:hypothetical protein
MTKVAELEGDARRIAAASGDLRAAPSGIRQMVRIVELMANLTGRLDGKPAGPAGVDNRKVIFNFPVLSPEALAAVENAPTMDLPTPARRPLERPSDGAQR